MAMALWRRFTRSSEFLPFKPTARMSTRLAKMSLAGGPSGERCTDVHTYIHTCTYRTFLQQPFTRTCMYKIQLSGIYIGLVNITYMYMYMYRCTHQRRPHMLEIHQQWCWRHSHPHRNSCTRPPNYCTPDCTGLARYTRRNLIIETKSNISRPINYQNLQALKPTTTFSILLLSYSHVVYLVCIKNVGGA